MNAIYGFLGPAPDGALQGMASRLTHRGAAQRVQRLADDLAFGCGAAAVEGCLYADQNFAIVCDADIYNKQEIREFLAKNSVALSSESDAELLLALVRTGGTEALAHLNGDFAFAVWDKTNGQLLLGRDYCGCRPLYYGALAGGGFAFATEYKALTGLPGLDGTPDRDMLQCLQYRKKLPIGRTLLRGVQAAVPGAIEVFGSRGEKIDCRKMAAIQPRAALFSEEEALAEVRRSLAQAIECRVLNPARIGIALSGGIDSIGIAFICRSLFPDAEIHTFTAGAGEGDVELDVAARAALAIGAEHHVVVTPPDLMKDHLEKLVWHLEDPVARSESLQLLKVGEAAGRCVDSLLCGMEADALFAGMPRHKLLWLMAKWPIAKRVLGEIYTLTQSGLPPESAAGRLLAHLHFRKKTAPVPKVAGSQYLPSRTEFPRERRQFVSSFLQRAFQDGACQDGAKVERTFAAWGVRYQSPFLDRNVIRAAFSIPDELKFKNGKNKYILRKALQAWVPPEFWHIPKRPQRMNYDAEFAKTLDQAADLYLEERRLSRCQVFSPGEILKLKNLKRDGVYPAEAGMRLWTAVLTQIWCEQFVRGE